MPLMLKIFAHKGLCFFKILNVMKITLYITSAFVFEGGLKFPHKIHFNTQRGVGDQNIWETDVVTYGWHFSSFKVKSFYRAASNFAS